MIGLRILVILVWNLLISSVISQIKFFFGSRKNSSHVMKDLKMTNKLKVSICAMVEEIGSFSFQWLRKGS